MAKKIKITHKQLEEAMNLLGEENVKLALAGSEKDPLEKRVKDTMYIAQQNGLDSNKTDVVVADAKKVVECSNTFTKTQILEARRNYLNNNSENYTKESFIKKRHD